MSHVSKFETVINNVSITLQPSWNNFRNLCLWIKFVIQLSYTILSTAIAQFDKSNCIKPHWKHNHSDVNDAVHVRIVQFYFDHNFQLSIHYHKRKVIAYVNWFQNHNY